MFIKNYNKSFYMLSKYLKEKNVFIVSVLVCLIMLSTPLILRRVNGNDTFPGSFSYYHARMARDIVEKNNDLSEDYRFNPYHPFLGFFAGFMGVESASKVLPIILGMVSFLVFYLILKNLKISLLNRLMILGILVLSPVYVYTFSISSPFSLVILLDLLGLYFFFKRKKMFLYLSIIFFLITVFFEPINTLVVLLLLLSYSLYDKNKSKYFKVILMVLLPVYVLYYVFFFLNYGLPIDTGAVGMNFFESNITDLGGLIGFSVFTLFSALMGVLISWKEKSRLAFVYVVIFMLLGLSFLTSTANYYLNFFLPVFGGLFFYRITTMNWENNLIRNLTVLLLLYGFLFSVVSYVPRVSGLMPNNEIEEGLSWLGDVSEEDSVIFSYPESGFWIEYFSRRKVVLDSLTKDGGEVNDTQRVLNSRILRETKKLLDKYDVAYVYIDDNLKQMIGEDKGLLFLLRNNETFKMRYNNPYVSIWRYHVE